MNLTVKCFWIHCHIVNCQLRVLVLLGWKTMLPRTFPENGCWWRRKQRFSRFVVPYRISLQKQPFEVIKKTMKSSAACGFVFWTCWLVSSNTRTLIVTSGKLCCGSFYQNSSFQPNIWHGWDLLRVFNARLKVIGILSSRTGIWQISIPALPFFRPYLCAIGRFLWMIEVRSLVEVFWFGFRMIGRIGRMWNVGLGDGSGILAGSLGSQVVVEGMREISHKLPGRKYHFNLFLTPFQTSTNKKSHTNQIPKAQMF